MVDTIPFWLQLNQQIVLTIIALLLVFVFSARYFSNRDRDIIDKIVSIILVGLSSCYLLWIYIISPAISWVQQNWVAIIIIIGAIIFAVVMAWRKGWISKPKIYNEEYEPHNGINKPLFIKEPAKEYIYVMECATQPKDYFKIGSSRRSSDLRADELSAETGAITRYHVIRQWEVPDCHKAESLIHQALDEYRVNPKREFFQVSYSVIFAEIDRIAKECNNLQGGIYFKR